MHLLAAKATSKACSLLALWAVNVFPAQALSHALACISMTTNPHCSFPDICCSCLFTTGLHCRRTCPGCSHLSPAAGGKLTGALSTLSTSVALSCQCRWSWPSGAATRPSPTTARLGPIWTACRSCALMCTSATMPGSWRPGNPP